MVLRRKSNIRDVTASMFYGRERGTTVYSGRETTWVGKVGLMYPSDYGYATSGGSTTSRKACLEKGLGDWGSSSVSDCGENAWLSSSCCNGTWTITPDSEDNSFVYLVKYGGGVTANESKYAYQVRPVVFLKSNIQITGGSGSANSPYELSN